MCYAIVVEPTACGFSADVPELPGCIATARMDKEVRKLIAEGIALHLAACARTARVIGWDSSTNPAP